MPVQFSSLPVTLGVTGHRDVQDTEQLLALLESEISAIQARYPDLVRDGWLYTYATVKDRAPGSRLEDIDVSDSPTGGRCACGCNKAESKS